MKPYEIYNQSLDFLKGNGVPEDHKKSFRLNAEAAEGGYGDAILAMGWYYLNGIGVARDIAEANKWYRKSARLGEPRAMFSLGQIAYVQRDFSAAMRWFQRAAKAGHSRSVFWIGKLHWHGRGVKENKSAASRLFNEAAAKKVKEARRAIGWLNRSKYRSRTNPH